MTALFVLQNAANKHSCLDAQTQLVICGTNKSDCLSQFNLFEVLKPLNKCYLRRLHTFDVPLSMPYNIINGFKNLHFTTHSLLSQWKRLQSPPPHMNKTSSQTQSFLATWNPFSSRGCPFSSDVMCVFSEKCIFKRSLKTPTPNF